MRNRAGLWYSVAVRDRRGKVISRERRKSRSMLGNWYRILYAHIAVTSTSLIRTDGIDRGVINFGDNWKFVAAANEDYIGVVIGTGVAPVAIDQAIPFCPEVYCIQVCIKSFGKSGNFGIKPFLVPGSSTFHEELSKSQDITGCLYGGFKMDGNN